MTMKSNKLAMWMGAVAFALLAPLAHANYVTNGGFETGAFPPWTQTGDPAGGAVDCSGGSANSGNCAAVFFDNFSGNPTGAPTGITQSIDTTAGMKYVVSFYLANIASDNINSFSWSWDGVQQSTDNLLNADSFAYTLYSRDVFATGASTALSFDFANLDAFWNLDDVSVVPEPGTLALIGVAMIAGGVARRRKKLG